MKYPKEPIAITGMGCRYPGAPDPASFWRILAAAQDALAAPHGPRFSRPVSGFEDVSGPGIGGLLENLDCFDAEFFQLSPHEAACLDPQQRLLLEVAWEAFEDAGLTQESTAGARAGVFVGSWGADFENSMFAGGVNLDVHLITGLGRYSGPNRISFALDLRGPSIAVDTACSSALVAVHLACQSIWSGESEFALAGGVNVILRPEITEGFNQANMLAPDGRCKFGDTSANGYARSEGAGIVVLKPLSRAVSDGDRIYAIIRGSAVNNDGQSNHMLLRPSRAGHEAVLRSACSDAGVAPGDVQYVEAHGTGTRAGDPVEFAALGSVFGGAERSRPCLVGSVKTNIGHTEGAAGVAGLMKVALSLWHNTIPASLHFHEPSPDVPWQTFALAVQSETAAWPGPEPHIAGVSSLGLTGTNAHVVLEACPAEYAQPRPASHGSSRPCLVPLSAKSPQALDALAGSYMGAVEEPGFDIADIAYTAALRRTHHDERLALVVGEPKEFRQKLDGFLRREPAAGMTWGKKNPAERGKIAFVFPGQGAQWSGMGSQLFHEAPAFRDEIERCDGEIRRILHWSLIDLLTGGEALPERIDIVQPTLFAISAALARQWRDWGVEPDAVVGHSMGEVAAAYVAGALTLPDAATVICRRSELMGRVSGQGSMALVDLPIDVLKARISPWDGRLSIAASNSASSTVLSGETAALKSLLAELESEQIFCRLIKVDVASHSACVDPLRGDLLHALEGIRPRHGSTPLYSTVTGLAEHGEGLDRDYWVRNLREPVMFGSAVRQLIRDGFTTFIEVSPHPLLTASVQAGLAESERSGLSLPSLVREQDERASLLASAGALYVAGYQLDWRAVNGSGRCICLPTYPFQREHIWPELSAEARSDRRTRRGHAFLTPRVELASAPGTSLWEMEIGLASMPYLADHRVRGHVVFPGAGYLELVLAAVHETEDEACSLEDVQFANALVLADGARRPLQLTLSPRSGDTRPFSINSREADGSWRLLANGRVRFHKGPESKPEPLRAILARCTESLSGEEHFRQMAQRGLQYGPAFQLIDQVSHSSEECLVRIATATVSASESSRHLIHPAILDACLQAVGELFPDRDLAPEETYVPVLIERVRIFKAPEPGAELYAHAKRLKSAPNSVCSDVVLFDASGGLVAEISGFVCRPIDRVESGERCLYELAWIANEDQAAPSAPGRWLLFADRRGRAARIASHLESLGCECVLVDDAETFAGQGSRYRIDVASPADYRRLIEEAGPCDGILHAWSLDIEPDDDASWETLDGDQRLGTKSLTLLVRALAESTWAQPPRLWIATAGLHNIGGEPHVSLAHGPIWGLARVIACEHPELRCASVDLSFSVDDDEIALLGSTLLSNTGEDQIALRGKTRYFARFRDLQAPTLEPVRIAAGTSAYRAAIGEPSDLASLGLEMAPPPDPGPDDVAIEIKAAGLNFIDVLKSLGIYPGIEPGTRPPLGGECAGTVIRVGAGVRNLHPGDPIIAITPSVLKTGLMASRAVVPAQFVFPKPSTLSWEEAATLPLAFLTAWYGLHTLAGMQRGDRVLIHAGTGGVGLAAIQLAQKAGATVFATAGSAEKRRFLEKLGVEHVFDSRSTAFSAEILKVTGSAGVDIVLNSLSGELIEASIAALGRYGRFVEIGKRDIYEDRPLGLGPFRRNLSFFAVDLAAMLVERRDQVAALFQQLLNSFEAGELRPLPVRTYPASQVAQMFQTMAGAQQIGKLALTFGEPEVTVRPARPGQVELRGNGGYLITGGMGGIGLLVARWMVENGARYLVLAGRREPSEEAAEAIRQMRAQGAVVRTVSGDVSEPEDVRRFLASFGNGSPALRGVVHAAAVIDDLLIAKLDPARLTQVMAPKAYGAWNLHRETAGLDLDFFVMFSSIASVLPQPGHGGYAAANAFLDALARYRQSLGKPGLAINWGGWSATGLAVTTGAAASIRGYAARGIRPLSSQQGLSALGYLLGCNTPGALAVPVDWRKLANAYATEGVPPVLASLVQLHAQAAASEEDAADPLTRLRAAPPAQVRELVEAHLRSELARVLSLAPSRIDNDKAFGAMGLDSLMAVTFVRRLSASLGILLPATAAFNYPTISALALHVAGKLGLEVEIRKEPPPARRSQSPHSAQNGHELTDEQAIEALLAERGTP